MSAIQTEIKHQEIFIKFIKTDVYYNVNVTLADSC